MITASLVLSGTYLYDVKRKRRLSLMGAWSLRESGSSNSSNYGLDKIRRRILKGECRPRRPRRWIPSNL